jgi:hypothetical protein
MTNQPADGTLCGQNKVKAKKKCFKNDLNDFI